MRGWIPMNADGPRPRRPAPFDEDIGFSESLVAHFLDEFTRPGDLVLDPFAGFGTTLVVAERMGRRAIGVELLADRADYIRGLIADPSWVITGDTRSLAAYGITDVDFTITSPPYMTRENHPQNPLAAYGTNDGDYARYLIELQDIYFQIGDLMKPGAYAVINAANLRVGSENITPLAWDIGRAVSAVLHFEGEVVLCWDEDQAAITNDYCLVFQKR